MKGKSELTTVLASASRTSSGTADIGVLPGQVDEMVGYLSVTAATGTSPTLDVVYEVSPDEGTTWYTHTSFTQATGATTERKVFTAPVGIKGRFSYTLGGTSPDFTFSLIVEAKRNG